MTLPTDTDGVPSEPPSSQVVLDLQAVTKHYPVGHRRRHSARVLRAVDGIELTVHRGETVGLVGESGSGKSTVARLSLALVEATGGTVAVKGVDLASAGRDQVRRLRREAQMVFQDPYSSFDPLATVGSGVAEALVTHSDLDRRGRADRVSSLLELVGLDAAHAHRYPRQLSGGQLQRAAIARALAVEPAILVMDEPVSSLDVSTQAQIINLLRDLQDRLGIAYLFIAHDLAVVRHMSDRIAVMYLGRIVEQGRAAEVYERPLHPYTASLLAAIPIPHPARQRERTRIVLQGDTASPIDLPSGCRFRNRCPYVMDICAAEDPPAFVAPTGTTAYCHLHTSGPRLNGSSVLTIEPASLPLAGDSARAR